MKVLDLFSGIGGFSIGLEKAGFETVAFCEIEDYPRAVLRKHWPDTPIYRDIKQLTAEQLRADGIVPDVIAEDIPVSPSQLQENSLQSKTKDISFQRCLDLFEVSGQDGVFSKMLADMLNSVSTKLPHHWKMKVTPSGRLLFQLAPLMHHTDATGYGLWRTPETSQGGTVSREVLEQMASGDMMRKSGHQRQLRLQDQVRHPKLWPTPTASDYKGAPQNRYLGSETYKSNLREAARTSETDGQLNPEWVEWLMGYQTAHTELKHWETRSYRKSQKSSDKQ
jgi:hypothetical protein